MQHEMTSLDDSESESFCIFSASLDTHKRFRIKRMCLWWRTVRIFLFFYNFVQMWGRSNRCGELDTYNRSLTLLEVNEKNNRQLIYKRRRKEVKVNMLFGFPVFRPRKRGSRRTARLPLVSCTISAWFMVPLVRVGVFKTPRSVTGFC